MAIVLMKALFWWALFVILILRWFSVLSSWRDEEASERVLPVSGQPPGGRHAGEPFACSNS